MMMRSDSGKDDCGLSLARPLTAWLLLCCVANSQITTNLISRKTKVKRNQRGRERKIHIILHKALALATRIYMQMVTQLLWVGEEVLKKTVLP